MHDDDRREFRDAILGDVLAIGFVVPIEDAVDRLRAVRSDFRTTHSLNHLVGFRIQPPLEQNHDLSVLAAGEIHGVFISSFGSDQEIGGPGNGSIDIGFATWRFCVGDERPNLNGVSDIRERVVRAVRVDDDECGR